MPSSGRTGPGNRRCSGSPAASSTRTEAASRSAGSRAAAGTPAEARKLGLGIAYQTYSHVRDLSVAENLYLSMPRSEQPAYGRMEAWATEKLAEFDLDVPPKAPMGSLSLAQRQFLEVVKSLLARPKVLLLDEPTTALGPEDVERLHALVAERSGAGVGIVYVSHRLPEVLGIADRITVLRDGVSQGTFDAAGMTEETLVTLMIGRPLELAFPDRHDAAEEREVALAVSGLRGERFGPIELEVAKGEILGIAGAEGNGQLPFLRALAGIERADGERDLQRPRARPQIAARPAPRRGRAAQRRSHRGVAVPGPERAREHHDPGAATVRADRASCAATVSAAPSTDSCVAWASAPPRSNSPSSRSRAATSRRSRSPAPSCAEA